MLSQNRLEFSYYSFGDDGVDYKSALASTGTIDDCLFRNLSIESHDKEDLHYHLYTIDSKNINIPSLDFPDELDTLFRTYHIIPAKNIGEITSADGMVVLLEALEEEEFLGRTNKYVYDTNRLMILRGK